MALGAAAFGQSDSLALSSAVATPGGTVSLNLSLSSSSGSPPAAIQWTFAYSPSDVIAIAAAASASATAAGKSLACTGSPGVYSCFLTGLSSGGLDANVMPDGVIAVMTATMSPASSGTTIGITSALGASASASPIQTTATGGTITVLPLSLASFSCNPSALASGASATCVVNLNEAVSSNVTVTLSDNNALLTIPASVLVPAGGTSATVTASAGTLTMSQNATLTAALNGAVQTAVLSLVAPTLVSAVSCNPTSVNSGSTSTCTVTLSQPAAAGGSTVGLSSNNAALTVPASITVPANSASTTFNVSLGTIATTQSAAITATLPGSSQTANLSLIAPTLISVLACNPTSVNSGSASTCTVTLSQPAPAGGFAVGLSSNNAALTVPASITVTANSTVATFSATAGAITTTQPATMTATLGSSSQTANFTLVAPTLVSTLTCGPATLDAGASSTCTVTLSAQAPTGGTSVSVSANSPELTVPASVNIPAGSSSGTFTATATTTPPEGGATLDVSITATLNSASQSEPLTLILCPCSLWPSTAQPLDPASTNKQAIEVGMQFTSAIPGYITGVRFFKGSTNVGTHVGNLWSSSGTRLAEVVFTNETKSGWQTAYFSSPVPTAANTTYVISYHAPLGHNAADNGVFITPVTNMPLEALADGQHGPNGVYIYGASAFPSTGASATNYWVDAIFNTSATIGTSVPVSVWPPTAVPKTPAAPSAQPAELGLRILSDVPGYVTGVRFYKSARNAGPHIGALWTSTGTLLASVTFTNESTTGWQQANFSSPVAILANTVYLVSYWSPKGYYADDSGYFATSGVTSQMLYAPPDGQYGSNGSHAAGNVFPASSASAANFWVDLVFTTAIQ
ncbi:MAG: DUF4082 domain-containing protein [Bryobacteraceae bacterium]